MRPYISVVIPAWNEEKYIGRLLRSLNNQTIDPEEYEIIVVDGNSADRTRQVARKYGARVFAEDKGSIGFARNLGAKHARGEIVAFVDADCIAPRGWLMRIKKTFRKDYWGIGGMSKVIGGRFRDKLAFLFLNYYWKLLSWVGLYHYVGFNCAFKRDIFLKYGGYNPDIKCLEDVEISLRLGRIFKGRGKVSRRLKMYTSPRRLIQLGIFRLLWMALVGYWCLFTNRPFPWDYGHMIDKGRVVEK